MHVLVIAQLFPPDIGGGSTRAYNVVKSLFSLGHKVTVITAFPHYPTGKIPKKYRHRLISIENFRKVKIIRTWVPPLASRGLARRLVLYISFIVSSLFAFPFTEHVDVVWAANPNILSVYPSLVYRLFKKCQVVQNVDDLWGGEELYNAGLLRSRLLRKVADFVSGLAYMTSAAITPISPAYVDVIVSRYKVDPKKVHVVPAGVDIDNFKAFCARENEGDTFNVLYIGSLALAYDFDCVLKAANLLSSENRIKFVIQGEGELGDYLRSKVKEMNLQNTDIILKVVSRGKVAEILSSADVLLLPLRNVNYTGISSKLYEYQASGRPIICCSKGQPARYISQTGSGIVVNPSNPNDLAKAIIFLFNNRELGEKLGKAGRRSVEENLSLEKIGSKVMTVFKQVLRNPPSIDKAERQVT